MVDRMSKMSPSSPSLEEWIETYGVRITPGISCSDYALDADLSSKTLARNWFRLERLFCSAVKSYDGPRGALEQ